MQAGLCQRSGRYSGSSHAVRLRLSSLIDVPPGLATGLLDEMIKGGYERSQ